MNMQPPQQSLSLIQRFWKVGVGASLLLVFLFVGYYIYNQYFGKTDYYANREHMPKDANSNKTATLMLFYTDWCPHCTSAKPEWEALKEQYDGKSINGYNMMFVEHDCTNANDSPKMTELMNQYGVEGYPTIKLIKDNQVIEYDAKPTKSTMEQFLNSVL